MDGDDLDAICAEYLARLTSELAGLGPDERQQIVEQVSEHIVGARAALPEQSEAAVRDILERLGTPEEIAAEARKESPRSLEWRMQLPVLVVTGVLVAVVVLGVGIAADLGAFSPGGGPPTCCPIQLFRPSTTQSVSGTPARVAVPAVVDRQLATAIQSLSALRLNYMVSYISSQQPVGTVLTQRPLAGSTVVGRGLVELTVSGTQTALTVPNVVGQSQAQAASTLQAVGLGLTVQGLVVSGHVPSEDVTAQEPAAGAMVAPHSDVSVTISAGPG
jgi:hypothetical protein